MASCWSTCCLWLVSSGSWAGSLLVMNWLWLINLYTLLTILLVVAGEISRNLTIIAGYCRLHLRTIIKNDFQQLPLPAWATNLTIILMNWSSCSPAYQLACQPFSIHNHPFQLAGFHLMDHLFSKYELWNLMKHQNWLMVVTSMKTCFSTSQSFVNTGKN